MPELEMVCVDLWSTQAQRETECAETYEGWDHDGNYERFKVHVAKHYSDRVKIVRDDTSTSAGLIEDESLDFVFIDADHTHEGCLKDIEAWTPKVRSGGMISGHDLEWNPVKRAVDETGGAMALPDNVWVRFKP